jgi:hypothetical protein
VERTHSLPSFEKGDKIKFITHANILVAYELCMDEVFTKLNDKEKETTMETNKGEEK